MRVLAITAYDGSRFFGSQIQENGTLTVMGRFEEALNSVGIFSMPTASGRTDSGVHALCQPIAFDIPHYWENELAKLKAHLNAKLSPYIQIKRLFPVENDFHPRFDAKKRVYRYIVKIGEPTPFGSDFVTFVPLLDSFAVGKAISIFEGEHDFSLFKKTGSDEKSSVRRIYKTSFYEYHDLRIFRFEGNAFLRSQIRLMMGALFDISDGKITAEQLREQLAGKARHTVRIAAPNGLYLSKVFY